MSRTHRHPLTEDPTLGEVRAFVAATQDLPEDARVRVRVAFTLNAADGSRPTRFTAIERDETEK